MHLRACLTVVHLRACATVVDRLRALSQKVLQLLTDQALLKGSTELGQ